MSQIPIGNTMNGMSWMGILIGECLLRTVGVDIESTSERKYLLCVMSSICDYNPSPGWIGGWRDGWTEIVG